MCVNKRINSPIAWNDYTLPIDFWLEIGIYSASKARQTMNIKAKFAMHASAIAVESGMRNPNQSSSVFGDSSSHWDLQAIETVSLLGDHGGIADDYVLAIMEEAAEA